MKDIITETIGCDLGDRVSTICVLGANNQVERHKVKTTREQMQLFFKRSRAHVVIEVGTHSRWVSTLLAALGHQVTVANPRRVQLIAKSQSKSDKRDAELLARLGRADVKLLSPIVHRGVDAQADLAVLKARDALVRTRSKLVTYARTLVKSFGERLPSCDACRFYRKTWLAVPAALRSVLEPIYKTLETLAEQISEYDRHIRLLVKKHPEAHVVAQPCGVGPITALAFMLTVEHKQRFRKSRMVGAYFGLQPARSQSGGHDPELHITKAGDPFVRKLLVNAATHALGPFGKDSDLRRWGLRLAERGGKNAKKRATIAVARKLATLMHRLWTTGESYQPLGYRRAA